ncbi:MAG TPA: oligosaccharide flippase family protein [Gemmataceae bacterium]|nr:oligosaccharide flippase family protein [Gemmataceae bacterium]
MTRPTRSAAPALAATGRRALIASAAANWLGFAAQLAVAFFLAPVLVHGLGDQRYGVWAQVEAVLAYLTLFDLGVAAAVVRHVARSAATRDDAELNRVVNTTLCVFAAAGGCAFAVALAVAFFGLPLLRVPPELVGEARTMLALLGANLAVGLPLSVFPSALDGLGRYPAKTAVRTALLLLRVPVVLWVLRAGGGLVELAWAITACGLVEHGVLAAVTWRYLPGLRLSPAWASWETFRRIRGYSLDALLALLAGRVSFQTDSLVIGAFLGPLHVTFFALPARLTEQVKSSLRAVTTVLTPAVSALEAVGDHAAIRGVLFHSTRWVLWAILPVQAGLLILGRPFLGLWLGQCYADAGYPVLAILALPLGLALSQSVSGRILYGIGRIRGFSRMAAAEAGANLLLSVALAGPLGIEGVAWGTAVPNLVFNGAVAVCVCRALGVGLTTYLRHSFLSPAAVAAGLAAAWLGLTAWQPPTTWAELAATGAAGLAGYAAAAALAEFGPRRALAWLRAATGRVLLPGAELRATFASEEQR